MTTLVLERFRGTANPRHIRALTALLRRPLRREELDRVAGTSNSPELVAELRRRGLTIPCTRIEAWDRDGKKCRPGVYRLTAEDRVRVRSWQTWGAVAAVPQGDESLPYDTSKDEVQHDYTS